MVDEHVQGTPSPSPPPCAKGCGFFGSASTLNMCSKCYREHQRSAQAEAENPAAAANAVQPLAPAAAPVPATPMEAVPAVAAAPAAAVPAVPPPRKVQKNTSRCFSCRKKIGLTGFKCRCGYVYCSEHRYSDKHACDFDYQASAREELEKANPVVVASKLEKI